MIRLGIIDLGTNSVRFDVHEIGLPRSTKGKALPFHRRLYREKLMVRLGQDAFNTGHLHPDAKTRTFEALKSFKETADHLEVDRMIAFGTSALRDASDGKEFAESVRKEIGLDIQIMPGEEEARLIARGVLANEERAKGLFALVDIGGGSTEISIIRNGKVLHSKSFNLGVARLQQVYLKSSPPAKPKKGDRPAVEKLRKAIKSQILSEAISEGWPKVDRIIGSSGTVLAMMRLASRSNGKRDLDRSEITELVDQMEPRSTAELLAMRGMEPKRVDLILAGAILLDEIVRCLKAKKVYSTEFSLRDGILAEELERYQRQKGRSANLNVDDIERRAEKWYAKMTHPLKVRENARTIFNSLQKVHKIKPAYLPHLEAAALLHDAGEHISPSQHPEHSEYIVKNAVFPGMRDEDRKLIGYLVRFHKDERISEKKTREILGSPTSKTAISLLSILQIADSLDRSHEGQLRLTKVRASGRTIEFIAKDPGDASLEMLRFEQKRVLFEKLFSKRLQLHLKRK